MPSGKQEKRSAKNISKFLHNIFDILKEVLKIFEVLKSIVELFQ